MQDYKKYIISRGEQEVGLTWEDIENYLLPKAKLQEFEKFMSGQTMGVIGGVGIVYTGDYLRFINGLNNND